MRIKCVGNDDACLSCLAKILPRYLWIYVLVLKSFLVYVFDIYTAITMLTTSNWSNHIFNSCKQGTDNGCVAIPFNIGKWLFVGCIIFSFLLVRPSLITLGVRVLTDGFPACL